MVGKVLNLREGKHKTDNWELSLSGESIIGIRPAFHSAQARNCSCLEVGYWPTLFFTILM